MRQPPAAVDTTLSPAAFRDAMTRFAATVTVVTTGAAEQPVGCTATSVLSISADPPSIGVSFDFGSRTLRAILDAGTFAVNVLARGQWALCARFATGAPQHRFDDVPIEHRYGVPLLTQAASSVVCRVLGTAPLLDHTLVIGQVLHAEAGTGEGPLVSYDRQPHRLLRELP
ncbi:flavin reductase family protein [Micromonospora peucetia]|uniref:flavin reductase family protein n=1 Tax=Micromonospora peucetia TaxID=47871 RepID=UPI003333CB46